MPVEVTAHKAKLSGLKVTISATLTKVRGLENFKINYGEGQVIDIADLDADSELPIAAGLTGAQSATFDLFLDPLGSVHQFLQAAKNDQEELVGAVVLGATGVETSCKFVVTKWDVDAEKGGALKAACEIKFTERLLLNEADPA